ncbi:MAG: phosphonate ABC transporter, permease protein PhnE [Bacilli bacterium]|nr:phosphonate ABC transporter, permease protein PhnE [Bacilli bacterium]MBN2876283.1 phosphonate ABC transporter, permease protein PhnE [Bacilli bacterium]
MERGQVSPDVLRTLNKEPSNVFKKTFAIAIIAALSIWSISAITFEGINDAGLKAVLNVVKFFFWPDSNPEKPVLLKYFLSFERYAVPYLMYETIMIAFVGTLIGAIISIPFAFLSSKNITGKFGSFVGSLIITLIRTVPIFIWGLIFIRVKGGAMAGVLAISVASIGMISKLYVEVIEDIDTGILEALDSIGATTLQKIRFGILPQLTASFLSTAIYRFEINVKNATILGMVGAGGIGFTLIDALGSFNFGVVAVCLWGIIPVVLLIEFFSTRIRARLTGSAES